MKIIEKNIEMQIKEFIVKEETQNVISKMEGSDDYAFKVIMTHEDKDRDGETVVIDGMDSEAYMKNSVVIVNHNYEVESIVGKISKIYKDGKNLIAEGTFAQGVEKAELCRALYNQGCLKTVSMGFIVKQRDTSDNSIITNWELLELSFVPVPANAGAVSLDGKVYKKCIEQGLIKEISSNKKEMKTPKPMNTQITQQLKDSGINRCYVVEMYTKYVVYVTFDEDYMNEKYFKDEYSIEGDSVKLAGNPEEVEKLSSWEKKELDMKVMKDNMKEIRDAVGSINKSLKTFSEDNEKKINREKVQDIVKGMSAYLRDTKPEK